jgi:hypothetical protein
VRATNQQEPQKKRRRPEPDNASHIEAFRLRPFCFDNLILPLRMIPVKYNLGAVSRQKSFSPSAHFLPMLVVE